MRIPRDVGGEELTKLLERLGYEVVRQTGSHIRLSMHGRHNLTIPRHRELRVGTVSGIIGDVAEHLHTSKADVLDVLWG